MDPNGQKRTLLSVLVFVMEVLQLTLAGNVLEGICSHTVAYEEHGSL
jgi:hypothetical protein